MIPDFELIEEIREYIRKKYILPNIKEKEPEYKPPQKQLFY